MDFCSPGADGTDEECCRAAAQQPERTVALHCDGTGIRCDELRVSVGVGVGVCVCVHVRAYVCAYVTACGCLWMHAELWTGTCLSPLVPVPEHTCPAMHCRNPTHATARKPIFYVALTLSLP